MSRVTLLAALLCAACAREKAAPADSGFAAIDTLKPATVTDTLATDTAATKAPASKTPATKTSPKLGRDSAIQNPRLPQLDTVKRRKP